MNFAFITWLMSQKISKITKKPCESDENSACERTIVATTATTSPHHPTWDGRTKKGLSVPSSKAPKLRQNPTPKPVMCPTSVQVNRLRCAVLSRCTPHDSTLWLWHFAYLACVRVPQTTRRLLACIYRVIVTIYRLI